ncbi:MAG: ATPase [Clostridiales Family XIII bacterium]|jgi:DNA anti-recombination protein RmuC|nr:ATPase [Clostridiales Family XIII bacterium]
MKVLELLDEIDEIVETASGVPLTGRILIDGGEITEIVKEIRVALPDEITQAQWIKQERQHILDEAKREYEIVMTDARNQADALVEESEITQRAKARASEISKQTEASVKQLKLDTYNYIDKILFEFQEKMEQMNAVYFGDMFTALQKTFEDIGRTVQGNRMEIKDLAYKTHMEENEY